ncbi:C-reactive protein [Bombina bombina]|uniref:C-reactive protein n=1 Tax=Bombina bombina TaxID=8345 RepID=UPI00235A746D|nr:C-reactive protein [Bombina bombina]
MEKILLSLLLLVKGTEILAQKDMDGKVFLFYEETNNSYVHLMPEKNGPFNAFTVCLRFYTILAREYSLFSFATPSKDNDLLLFIYPNQRQLSLSVGNQDLYFDLKEENIMQWKSICVSWESSTGVVVLWVNGTPYPRKVFQKGYSINANPIIMIGQEQDSYGGKFNNKQCFVGEISDVQMWDSALSSKNINNILSSKLITGNVVNWKSLKYNIYGKSILLEDVCPVYYIPGCLQGHA